MLDHDGIQKKNWSLKLRMCWLMTGFERKKEELIPHWIGGGDEEVDASKREVLSSCLDKNKCEQQAI